ncbi:unnamed protein product [Allacma fusca]|uniref:DUF4789 domain-containing protein n=1 Tax=Allacma fusca TaxID=39272 RepID=A0A8J2LMG1_9HEXA|nr:unnamed protein product [Allacma fusca]
MPNTKVIIAAASLLVLAALLIVIIVVTHKASGNAQNCPAEVQKCPGKDELFHLPERKCFLKGETPEGVCTRNMAILPVVSCRKQGQCECNYEGNNRWLVYHNETNECHFVYTQGFCQPGEWIELSKGLGVCKPNLCASEIAKEPGSELDWVAYNGKCYRLFTDLNLPGCKGPIQFFKNFPKAACTEPRNIRTSGVGAIPPAECPPGSFQAVNGHCQPPIEFDFD